MDQNESPNGTLDGILESNGNNWKYANPGSKSELYAKEMVLWKYPDHEIKFQTPTVKIDNTTGGIMRLTV